LLAVILATGVIAAVFRLAYMVRIANLESGKMLLQEQIADLRGRIETRDETISILQLSAEKSKNSTSTKIQPILIDEIFEREESKLINAVESTMHNLVVDKAWILHFNISENKTKRITFLEDGSIGDGRNSNEFQWRIEGDRLVIIRQNGDVQNVFRRDPTGRLIFIEDDRAKGFKDQFLEPILLSRK
jgi:hypothetical protein